VSVFVPTDLPGVFVVEAERFSDERGWFARMYCRREFEEHGIEFVPVQASTSYNKRRATLRGLHYQGPPRSEAKLVRCTAGAAYDVAVDLREGSPSFGKWTAAELTAENSRGMFIPEGFAHGFQTLTDDTEMLYLISEFYDADSSRGLRWNDPEVAIEWPYISPRVISERDQNLPYLHQPNDG
jgi:dTDP-4-dehydrorhamnose 3,5-epimerase